jgi:hypothetical protein
MKNYKLILVAVLAALFLAVGCTSLKMNLKPVSFTPYSKLIKFKKLEPDEQEKNGILLRLYQQNKVIVYTDFMELYTHINEGDNGLYFSEWKRRKMTFSPGLSIDDFEINTETESTQLNEVSENILLLSNRGEILKFIKGGYNNSKGTLTITDWNRSPIFPENSVKIGDAWKYTEKMKLELKSYWITRNVTGPDEIEVVARLTGFAEINGHRCAVIETMAFSNKNESYTALFKTMNLTLRTHITEKIFFDYKKGIEVARVTKTVTNSFTKDMSYSDMSKSQMISVLKVNRQN